MLKKVTTQPGTAEHILVESFAAWLEENRQAFTEDLVRLVRIRSVGAPGEGGYPFGIGCARCLEAALDIAERLGLRVENNEYYCGSAILDGECKEEIGIVGHLDVVTEGNGWHWPPFEGTVIDGHVIGRGASDDKGAVVMALYALKYLKDQGIKPKWTIRVLMGCNEESGMEDVLYYKTHYTPPMLSLCCDTGFPFHYGEKGRYTAKLRTVLNDSDVCDLSGGTSPGTIADEAHIVLKGTAAEKALSAQLPDATVTQSPNGCVTVTATGRAGHTAFPEGTVNAIQKLAKAVCDSGIVCGETRTKLGFLADAFADYYGAGLNIAFEDEPSGKLTHAGGMLRMENGRLEQTLNIRYPVTMPDAEALRRRIHQACETAGWQVCDESENKPFYISRDLPVLRLLDSSCREFLDLGDDVPFVMRGGTHCGKFPNTVGYGPYLQSTPEREAKKKFGGAHGADEAVRLDELFDAVCVYAVTLVRLGSFSKQEITGETE